MTITRSAVAGSPRRWPPLFFRATLDSIEAKYRDHGATVTVAGLDRRSTAFHQRLTGRL